VWQFSPAAIIHVIALWPSQQRTMQVRRVEWIMLTTHVHVSGPHHLCGHGGRAWEHGYHQSLLTSAHVRCMVTDHGQTAWQ